ncbi:exopolysaccharide biosynthesis protein [Candidatus Saccharibacteria bacterium]|nr:exopolysaccharide biosynthesis protein [Candidatus Saccharibacteria bacterium]
MIDIHSHILPGIDDGSKGFSDSLAMLKGMSEQGITDVIATPHFVNGSSYMSTAAENRILLKQLQIQAKKAGINIRLYIGNEIYIDRDIADFLRSHTISSLASSKYLLVELPMSGEYQDYDDILYSLHYQGYNVILAHPERYHTVWKDFDILDELADGGILFQCNLGSFIGQYGRHAQKTARKLAKNGMIFALGTDIHHRRDYSEISAAIRKLRRYYDEDELNRILVSNPLKIIKR